MDTVDAAAETRLHDYFDAIGALLGSDERRASFATYAFGLIGDGERKSAEPIAARACPDRDKLDACHQRLLHFLVNARWSDRDLRRFAARYAVSALTGQGSIESWLLDDTGFLKQGVHSVGVQRQYTGSAGKIANCQIGVSLSLATRREHVPIDFELYLPKSWTEDQKRRDEAHMPPERIFKTKPELALEMIDRALDDGFPVGMLLADAGYGHSTEFREQLRQRGFEYAVGVENTTMVWQVDAQERRRGAPVSLRDLALRSERKQYRQVCWRAGSKGRLTSRFLFLRVVPSTDDGWDPASERERLTLVVEWPAGEAEPSKFWFVATEQKLSQRALVRLLKERWRTERVYQELKDELGLDHYEGRRFPGWHHHVTVALCCYAFLVAERSRRFSPSAPRQAEACPFCCAA